MVRSSRLTLVLAVVVLSVAACSSGTDASDDGSTTTTVEDGSGGASTTEATTATTDEATTTAPAGVLPEDCLLLTPDDLEAATGVTFGDGTVNADLSNDRQIICDWVSTDLSAFAFAQVLIADFPYEETKSGTGAVYTLVDVSIPGATKAYATEEGSIVGMEVGGLYVQVSYIPSDSSNVLDITTQLATEAVAAM